MVSLLHAAQPLASASEGKGDPITPSKSAETATSTTHAGIEPKDVVDAALAMVEEGGPDALTMRKLASELGVSATSVYWHVGQRDEVVAAVLERHREQMRDLPVTGDTGAERIFCAAKNIWRSSLDHRNLTRLANRAGANDQGQPLVDALFVEVARSGVPPDEAVDLVRALVNTVAGFLVQALRSSGTSSPGLALGSAGEVADLDPAYRKAAGRSVELEIILDRALHRLIPPT